MRILVALLMALFLSGAAMAAESGEAQAAANGTETASEPADEAETEAAAAESESVPLPRRLAEATQSAAEGAIDQVRQALTVFTALGETEFRVDWAAFGWGILRLAMVVLATFAAFIALRWLARGVFAQANRWALGGDASFAVIRRVVAVAAAVLVDALVVVLAWVAGYAVALFLVGEAGSMATQQSLFLNAFLLIEIAKALIRMVFASRDDGLRLLPLAAGDAAYWNKRLAAIVGFLGYGLMLVVPVVTSGIAPAVGAVLEPLIKVAAFIAAVVIIRRNRDLVRTKLLQKAAGTHGATGSILAVLGRIWHVLAIGYVTGLLVASLVPSDEALPFMMAATLQTLLAIAVGVFLSVLLGQLMRRPLRVPERTREHFPLLEQRINGFVPRGLQVVRIFIGVVVAAVIIDAWRVFFDFGEWLASDAGLHVVGALISVAFIVILAVGIWIGFASWIEHRLNPNAGKGEPGAREKTLLSLFRNAATIALVTVTAMICLSELGVNIGPLIAGAGVLGLAIGFGAQKLVQDIITGVFIQLENAINTGDFITVAAISGTVERLSIRSVGLRDLSGTFHIVPFSSVDTVSNFTREFAYHLGVYGIAYHESVDEAVAQLQDAFEELKEDAEVASKLLGGLEVDGVTQFADSAINIRVRIMTTPGDQWSVGRAYNKLVKKYFDSAGIEIPFPHRTLYFGDGNGPSKLGASESTTSDAAGRPSEGDPAAEG
jgi:small conductance mechanosensitive channel